MNATAKMAALLAALRTEMNGAMVEAMEERGIHYPLSYGVSLSTIRRIATPYAPDHALARLLYRQQVRELQLAALIVADPRQITPEEAPFWLEGVQNGELAENLARLLGETQLVPVLLQKYTGRTQSHFVRYAVLLSAARSMLFRPCQAPEELLRILSDMRSYASFPELRAMATSLTRLAAQGAGETEIVTTFLHSIEHSEASYDRFLRDEIFLS